MIIDFRIRPPARSLPRLKIFTRLTSDQGPLHWHGPLPSSVTQRSLPLFLEEMQECGIAHGLVWGRSVADPDESSKNEDIAAIVSDSGGRFSGLGGVAIPESGEIKTAMATVEHAVHDLGLRGITLEPGYSFSRTRGADDPRLYPLYDLCQDLGCIVGFTISIRAGEDMSYSSPIAMDRVAGEFPKMKIVVSHSFWPWVEQACGLAYRRKNVHLHPDFYGIDFPGYMHWVEAANTYLADRLIFGSAYPLIGLKAAVDGYARLPFRDDVRERVMWKNAAALLELDPATL